MSLLNYWRHYRAIICKTVIIFLFIFVIRDAVLLWKWVQIAMSSKLMSVDPISCLVSNSSGIYVQLGRRFSYVWKISIDSFFQLRKGFIIFYGSDVLFILLISSIFEIFSDFINILPVYFISSFVVIARWQQSAYWTSSSLLEITFKVQYCFIPIFEPFFLDVAGYVLGRSGVWFYKRRILARYS